MNQQKAKLLRKVATLTGRNDKYIKQEFKKMTPELQQQYLEYMRENILRIKQNPPKQVPIVIDQRIREEE